MNEIMKSRNLSHQQTSRLIIQCEMMLVQTFVCVSPTHQRLKVQFTKNIFTTTSPTDRINVGCLCLCADHRYGKTLYFFMLDAAQKPPGQKSSCCVFSTRFCPSQLVEVRWFHIISDCHIHTANMFNMYSSYCICGLQKASTLFIRPTGLQLWKQFRLY